VENNGCAMRRLPPFIALEAKTAIMDQIRQAEFVRASAILQQFSTNKVSFSERIPGSALYYEAPCGFVERRSPCRLLKNDPGRGTTAL